MARVVVPATVQPGGYTDAGALLTEVAADVTLKNYAVMGNRTLLIAHNGGASPYTVTVTSAADKFGRTNDLTAEAIAAGAIRIFGPFARQGWAQPGNQLFFEASNAAVLFAVLLLD